MIDDCDERLCVQRHSATLAQVRSDARHWQFAVLPPTPCQEAAAGAVTVGFACLAVLALFALLGALGGLATRLAR